MRKIQSGRSMIEMFGVLGIMAMITALAVSSYTSISGMQKLNGAKTTLLMTVNEIRELYTEASNYEGLSMDQLINIGYLKRTSESPTYANLDINSDILKLKIMSGTCSAPTDGYSQDAEFQINDLEKKNLFVELTFRNSKYVDKYSALDWGEINRRKEGFKLTLCY